MTDLLLDTHALLWWEDENPSLGAAARAAIRDFDNRVFVSAATIWEVAIKVRKGKLKVRGSMIEAVARNGFHELPILAVEAEAAGSLIWDHSDPFDRLLVAQAIRSSMVLVTTDRDIRRFGGVSQLWARA